MGGANAAMSPPKDASVTLVCAGGTKRLFDFVAFSEVATGYAVRRRFLCAPRIHFHRQVSHDTS